MSRSLTITAVEGLPEIQPGDDIIRQIAEALSRLAEPVRNGDIAVVAQKVVSKAHNCFRNLNDIEPRAEALEIAAATDKDPRVVEVVLQESRSIVRQAAGVLIAQHKSGHIMANAGLDRSNVRGDEDHVLVLPDDPDGWCRDAAVAFEAYLGVRMGVVMADSFGRPWRLGTAGVAIGAAGIQAKLDVRGRPDRFGRPLESTEIGIADEVAAAASLLMGQTDEGIPVCVVSGLDVAGDGAAADLLRPSERDVFR